MSIYRTSNALSKALGLDNPMIPDDVLLSGGDTDVYIEPWNLGIPHSEDTKNKIRESKKGLWLGNKNPSCNPDIKKLRREQYLNHNPMKNEESKEKVSAKNRERNSETLTCPKCGKVGKSPVMYRHHFDNCKSPTVNL